MKAGWEAGNRVRGWKVSSGGGQGRVFGGRQKQKGKQGEEKQKERVGWVFFLRGGGGNIEEECCDGGCVSCQEHAVSKYSLKGGWEG